MIAVREAIVVEGKYDKIKLSGLVEGLIVETGGFSIFKSPEQLAYLRRLAAERGVILLLDSDGAGFLIRGRLASMLPPEQVKHAYIPDVFGRERRKSSPSKEGKLGVEGMDLPTLQAVLERAGATIDRETVERKPGAPITKGDFYDLGLTGGKDSAARRRRLQRALELPERLSANGLLQAVNALYPREDFLPLAARLLAQDPNKT